MGCSLEGASLRSQRYAGMMSTMPNAIPAGRLRPGMLALIDGEWRAVHAVMVEGGVVWVRVDEEGARVTLRAPVGTIVEIRA